MRPFLLPILMVLAATAFLAGPAALAPEPSSAASSSKSKPIKVTPVRGRLRVKVGIADQKAEALADPRMAQLRLKYARRSVAWDTMQYDWQIDDVDAWLTAARAAGIRPVITFARSRLEEKRHTVPTAAQYVAGFKRFRQRWPWVKEYVASNESNHFGEPTGRRPKLAAQYYKGMRKACPSCKVAAATLLDYPNLARWSRQFVRYAGEKPKVWALHNYISANRFQLQRTREFLRAVPGEVWITEVGGLVRRKKGQAKLKEGPAHAAKVTRFIFEKMARVSPRITRVYLYHWNAGGPDATWDSGLIDEAGNPRPAYAVLQAQLRRIIR